MTSPTVFTTDRLLEFTSEAELARLVGATSSSWPVIAVKELVDDALDACEDEGIAPVTAVEVSTTEGTITVGDNGPGIAPDVVKRLTDLRTKTSSREAYVGPTRGAQGNALQTILAMPFALTQTIGRTVIEAHGIAHCITFTMDHVHRVPKVSTTQETSLVKNGTSITVHWPFSASSKLDEAGGQILQIVRRFTFLNPHAAFRLTWNGTILVEVEATNPSWRKWRPSEPAPIHWYDSESFSRHVNGICAPTGTAGGDAEGGACLISPLHCANGLGASPRLYQSPKDRVEQTRGHARLSARNGYFCACARRNGYLRADRRDRRGRGNGKFKGRRCIWGGRAPVREVLYMAAMSASNWNPVFKAFHKRLKAALEGIGRDADEGRDLFAAHGAEPASCRKLRSLRSCARSSPRHGS
jgi:hypothetical protein